MKNIEKKLDKLTSSDELNNLKKEVARNTIEDVERDDIKGDLDYLKKSILQKIDIENVDNKEQTIDDVDSVFKKWLEELTDKKETSKEKRAVRKIKKINFDNVDVKQEKQKSFDRVLSSITNWRNEKNPVAKILLRMADWVLSTEK